jgi:hypothetical protein
MSPHLKLEREEFLARSYLALGQYDRVSNRESPGRIIMEPLVGVKEMEDLTSSRCVYLFRMGESS